MSGVYVVVATNGKGEIEVCETFAGQQAAVSCVQEVSGNTFNHYPNVEVMSDNSIRWNYVKTTDKVVSIYWKAIKISHVSQAQVIDIVNQAFGLKYESISKDDETYLRGTPVPLTIQIPIIIEPSDIDIQKLISDEFARCDRMPGGFDWNDNPVLSAMLFEDPENVKPSSSLSDVQKMALVTARVKKLPNFSLLVPFVGTFIQSSALHELKANTTIGKQIIKMECDLLDRIREEEIKVQYQIRDY